MTSRSTPPSFEAVRIWRSRSLCTFDLAKNSDGHGLVVQLGAVRRGVRADLAIGVETGECRVLAEHILHGFHFLANALAHEQLASDATDKDGDPILGLKPVCLMRRIGCAFDQPVEISAH